MPLFKLVEDDETTLGDVYPNQNVKQDDEKNQTEGGTDTSSLKLTGAKIAVPAKEGSGLVNVVSDYSWTLAPKAARKDTPYMFIIERKLTNDVMIQQMIYNLLPSLYN